MRTFNPDIEFAKAWEEPEPLKPKPDTPISRLRERFGLSQAMAAEALDVSQPMIAQVESGDRRTPPEWDVEAAFEAYTANRDADLECMRRIIQEPR